MASYKKNEARAWALENMRGVANVVIPTFTQDLKRLNETAIRYDIEKEIEYIAERCKKAKTLFIADANFSILERDAIFAKKMHEMHIKYGWPYNVAVQWNKD